MNTHYFSVGVRSTDRIAPANVDTLGYGKIAYLAPFN